MAYAALSWAMKLVMPTDAKMLLLHYADRANAKRNFWCFSGVRDTERRTGLRRERIALLNRCLAAAGLLTIERGHARRATSYRVHVDATLAEPLKIPVQRRGRKWSELTAQPATSDSLIRARCGPHVRPAVLRTSDPQPALQLVPEPVLPKCLGTSRTLLRNVPLRWPTSKMIGYARRRALDPAEVLDRMEGEARDLGMPWPPDGGSDWDRRWYATCEAAAQGYTGHVSAGQDDICSRVHEPDDP